MRTVVCDTECDSLAPTKVWCVVAYDIAEDKEYIFDTTNNFLGLKEFAASVDRWIGHNFLMFDRPALNNLLGLDIKIAQVRDTLILSRLFNISRRGGHSLENFGTMLGVLKPEHEDFSCYSPEMLERCRADVRINREVLRLLKVEGLGYSEESIVLEHTVQYLLGEQKKTGFAFDTKKAHALYATCRAEADKIRDNIHVYFRPLPKFVKTVRPKYKKDGTMSIVGIKTVSPEALEIVGGEFSLIHWEEFNLNSPKQVVERLNKAGWQPTVFNKVTAKMKLEDRQPSPKICEENLETLPDTAPESAKLIAKYLLLDSRCKNIITWFNALGSDDRVHGDIISLGASTHRAAHRNPNTANIPATLDRRGKVALYGRECRECWTVFGDNRTLLGVDASGIQLRILAHYMNDKEYTYAVVYGKKEDGSDIHSVNMRAVGAPSREIAKTFIYAWLLGAGYKKVGLILGLSTSAGKAACEQFLRELPALARVKAMAKAAHERGYMVGLDGRRVQIPSEHKALSCYLQAGEAVIMKRAYVFAYNKIKKAGLDAKIVGWIHDEYQIDCAKEHAEEVGKLVIQSIKEAGEYYKLRVPLDGEMKIGRTWAETH